MKAFGNIEKDSQVRAVASDAISSGKPVVINSDGTVSEVSGVTEALGTESAFNAITSAFFTTVFDSSNNKHIIVYRTSSNMRYVVATVASDGGVSFGTDAVVEASDNQQIASVFDSTNNRIVVVYRRGDDSDHGYAIVGSLSGTTVTWGSPTEFNNASVTGLGISFDSTSGKVVICYRDQGNSNFGTAIVGTVSGTSISFGSEVVFNSASTNKVRPVYDSTNDKTVILYRDDGNSSHGTAIVGTVSGTSISFGSEVVFEAASVSHLGGAFDSDTGKVVVAYRDDGNNNDGTAIVGTVSGTSISFGTPVVFDDDGDYGENTANSVIYDSNAKKVLVVYPRTVSGSFSNRGFVFPLSVSGTTIVADTGTDFAGATVVYPAISFDSNVNRNLIAFGDAGNSEFGTAVSYRPASTTLTSENYIGMLSGVVTGEVGSTGTAVSFESGTTTLSHVAFDSSNNRVVIAYSDGGNSDKGTAVVGTVSGTSISFGSLVIYEQGGTANIDAVFDSSNNKVVIVYQDNGDSGRGKGIVGTVDSSDNSISFGSATQFNEGANNAFDVSAAFDSSNNKVVIAYRDNGNSDFGTAVVGTVSGTSISFGTPVVFESANSQQTSVTFDSSNNKVVIGYKDTGNSDHGTAIVGTVSGTSISFGSAAVFNAGETSQIVGTFDSSNNKVVLAYRDNGNSDQGTAIVGTVSGTSISFGSEVIFNTANTQGTSAVFDTNTNKVLISYEDRGDSDKGKFIVGTVSGTSISFDTETGFSGSNAVFQTGAAFDSNANKVVIAYANDTDSSDRGEAIVTSIDSISRAQIANGGKAVIDSTNTISRNQRGLTAGQTLFVQTDGTLSETADDPSVTAGTAISATELIVKG